MRKILVIFVLLAIVFCFFNAGSVEAKKGKSSGGITPEQVTAMNDQLNKLTEKMSSGGLFSPEDNTALMTIKMQLDDQMLIAPDPTFAPLYYKLGKLMISRDMKDDGVDCFETLIENFSDTALAPKAAKMLKDMGISIKADAGGAAGGAST